MNFLSAFLPGVREVRNPLLVGASWFVLGYVLLQPHWPSMTEQNPGLARYGELVQQIPPTFSLTAFAIVLYLGGSVALEIAHYVNHHLGRVARMRLARTVRRINPGNRVQSWLYGVSRKIVDAMSLVPIQVRGPILDAVSGVYAAVGANPSAQFAFPIEALVGRLDTLALQFWKSAPEQYQEYDRLNSEADFKSGVILPLLGLGVVAARDVSWLLVAPVLLVASVLGYQAHKARRRADVMVAVALYLGTIEIPLLQAFGQQLKTFGLGTHDSEGAWLAATVISLERLAEFDASEEALIWLGEILGGEVDQNYIDLVNTLDAHGSQSADLVRRRVASWHKDEPANERPARSADST